MTAELPGFKKVVRSANEIRVGDVLRVDLTMETGPLEETVTVLAEAPMLNSTTGISGTSVTSKQIEQLPLGDGTAYMLTRLAPGIMDSSDLHFARPADNGNLAGIVANGVQGGNEFTIDGAPNLSNARGVGFSPPSDAIAEFKVQTNAFDAQAGHTAGAVVNLALKSGTNAVRGAASYFNRDGSRTATPLLTSRFRDTANEALLTQQVANPFAGLLPGSTLNGATVQRQQLLRPFPEFGPFGIEENTGSDRYQAASFQLERRFKSGNSFTIQYTRSSLHDRLKYLNPADGVLEDRTSPNDRPNRLSLGSSIRLPFGHGQKWGSGWGDALDAVAGGWQVSGTYQYQSGFPLTWNSSYYDASCGDPAGLVSNIGKTVNGKIAGLDVPAWDISCFYFHDAAVQTGGVDNPALQRADQRIQLGNNVRYFPSTLPDLRTHQLHLLDVGLFKNVSLPRHLTLQFRIEFINALNYTVLWNPDTNPRNATFGFINQDRNNPRDIQLGLRLTF